MRYITLKRFGMLFLLVIAVGFFIAITAHAQANSPGDEHRLDANASPNWALAEAASASPQPVITPPAPTKDTCLSCHILGQNKGIWTPLARWILFGGLGMFFVLGVYRSANTWVTRSPWKSLTNRAAGWVDERYQVSEPLSKVLNKPVPKYALRWFYCLGGITAFLFVVQGITGILLAFYYKPTPEAAYASIQYIETQVNFGSAIRAIHHWCANGMIVICVAHMLRVFIMGAYKRPRELNWVSGVLLLVLTLVFGFTGYLLPWDQRAFWATTVGSEIAGAIPAIGNLALVLLRVGWNVTGETLSRFYGLHVIVVPLATVMFMFAHFMMIRRQGIAKPL
jgi:cytochrome b6